MKWSELPKEYQDLEKGFDNNADINEKYDTISIRFYFDCTPQGLDFWNKCEDAQSISELQPIPIISESLTTIEQIKTIAEGKISCANCTFNVNGICKAIEWKIPVHKENDFYCSDYKELNN